jgi:hypothetical protein
MPSPMVKKSAPLGLLLADAVTSEPVLKQGLSGSAAKNQDKPEVPPDPEFLWKRGGDPNDLTGQRWGVIAPEGEVGDRLLQVIKPLIDHRRQQQGGMKVETYRCPPRLSVEEAAAWRRREFDKGHTFSEEVPRYQLILGDLDQVPLSVQQVQSIDGFVGRLAFRTEDEYAAYVSKLLKQEKQDARYAQGRSLFYTVRGSQETEHGYDQLIAPSVQQAEEARQNARLPASEVLDLGSGFNQSPDELIRGVSGDQPSFLFSLSHGLGPPASGWKTEDQRQLQGAMSFSRKVWLGARELRGKRFLPGGVWFMFACYGAGTPATSAYRIWLEQLARRGEFGGDAEAVLRGLPKAGERPFISALPQAVLASEEGPLGFIGHIDLAWSYSYNENDPEDGGQSRPGRFLDILNSVLSVDRIGAAFAILQSSLSQAQTELLEKYALDTAVDSGLFPESSRSDPARRGHLWMLRQDLAGYILLGDPAARLSLSRRQAQPPRLKVEDLVASTFSFVDPMASAPATPSTAGSRPPDIELYEPAILRALLGQRSTEELAAEYQLDAATLRELARAYREGGRDAAARASDPRRR